jgi:hypothetical protein
MFGHYSMTVRKEVVSIAAGTLEVKRTKISVDIDRSFSLNHVHGSRIFVSLSPIHCLSTFN